MNADSYCMLPHTSVFATSSVEADVIVREARIALQMRGDQQLRLFATDPAVAVNFHIQLRLPFWLRRSDLGKPVLVVPEA